MKKNTKYIIIFISLFIFYFSFSMLITWDSAHYYSYVNIFEGAIPLSNWDIVRGPIFPIIIYLSNFLFGKTIQGLLITSFIFYSFMLFFIYKMLDNIIDRNVKKRKIIIGLIMAFMVTNPIIFGYYHTMLTEFVAITVAVIMCYMAWNWINIDFESNKKLYFSYSLVFVAFTVFTWFLKQPYISTVILPLFIGSFISLCERKKLSNLLQRLFVIVLCFSALIITNMGWNKYLQSNGVDVSGARNSSNMLGKQLILAIDYVSIINSEEIFTTQFVEDNKYLNDTDKSKLYTMIEKEKYNYNIASLHSKSGQVIDQIIIDTSNGTIGGKKALEFCAKLFFEHPDLVIDSYFSNYLAIINVYPTYTYDGVIYHISRKFDLGAINENLSIAEKLSLSGSNIFYMTDELHSRVDSYEQNNNAPILFRGMLRVLNPVFNFLFKFSFLLLPFVLIFVLISRFTIKRQIINSKLNLCIILLSYSFLHLLIHSVTGAIIDRYASPCFLTTLMGIILYIYILLKYKVLSIGQWPFQKRGKR